MGSTERTRLASRISLLLILPFLAHFAGVVASPQEESSTTKPTPFIRNTANSPREFRQGDDMLLTCVVSDLGNHTVWWSKHEDGKKTILTVADRSISTDDRVSVLHDRAPTYNNSIIKPGGDVWVLVIKDVTVADKGVYVCEVNSNPSLTSLYVISVLPTNESSTEVKALRSSHNYTECCLANGVINACLGFCSIHNILEGNTGIEPEACENQFPLIVQCMADFRNHVPCCERERVPDICQDLCRGEYTLQEDNVQSHFSCTAYTQVTLMCISEGIELLPRAPDSPSVEVLGATSLQVTWEHPAPGSPPPEHYLINVTTLAKFDPPVDISTVGDNGTLSGELDTHDDLMYLPKRMQVKVSASQTQAVVENLSPVTWYEISIVSLNRHGSSLTPYTIRALTLSPTAVNKTEVIHPDLPDIVSCCTEKGVKHYRCLRNLCDPSNRYISEPDMIVCAPWATEAFSCLANDVDHSDCCRARGMPGPCVELCTGNVTKIDYKYFRCVDYFVDYRSCLMKGYNVLPGPPSKISVTNINPTFVLLHWMPPEVNGESVSTYHAYFRPVSPNTDCANGWFVDENVEISYRGVYTDAPPYVLERLCPGTEYEVYVQAVNKHGTGDPSTRVLFHTPSVQQQRKLEDRAYNVSQCCRDVNVSPGCMPLCNYNARMTHVRALAATCTHELPLLLRCAVGGRNHQPCCQRRGVPKSCLSLCSGSFSGHQATPAICMPYIGNIMMCLEEGVGVLPGPVKDLHVTHVGNHEVTLVWQSPESGINVTKYQVSYEAVNKNSATPTSYKLQNHVNVTDTVVTVGNLTQNSLYTFFVSSVNEEGSSLPSSVLTMNVTEGTLNGTSMAGVASAPHSLVLDAKTATTLTVVWQPPEFAHPTDRFLYKLYFRALGTPGDVNKYNHTTTGATALRLEALTPNTQYVIYVAAVNDMGESRASETLLAWTDPAYPAFVETPTVHPINLIVEGGSMTVLCIAMGSPPPTVSLYISGILIHQDVTRHMVTVVHNVSRDMTDISCYADNGYGTPMQASRTITISRRPRIVATESMQVMEGRGLTLTCEVNAWPEPSLVWWRDPEGRVPVIHGGNYVIETVDSPKGEGSYTMKLSIKVVTKSDAGLYYCHARNAFGTFTHTTKVQLTEPVKLQVDVSECCRMNNVSSACIDACSFDELDFDSVMDKPECIPDFGKMMKCAADGSDHRSCCDQKGVPSQCLDWCRGEPVPEHHLCKLQWAPQIFTCFNEGQELLPGPPLNVVIENEGEAAARVSWDPPVKNPDAVELYRVFWRPLGHKIARKNDTSRTSIIIRGLQRDKKYEVAVKAGNHRGTSILTPTIIFTHLSYVTTVTSPGASGVAVAVGTVMVVIAVCVVVVVALLWARRRNLLGAAKSSANGISFENPSYIREQNGDTVQIAETPNGSLNGNITPGMNGGVNGGITGGISAIDVNGGVWNTHNITGSTPGFEDDLPNNGGYKRFNS